MPATLLSFQSNAPVCYPQHLANPSPILLKDKNTTLSQWWQLRCEPGKPSRSPTQRSWGCQTSACSLQCPVFLQRELHPKDQFSHEGFPSILESCPSPFRKVIVKEANSFCFTTNMSRCLLATPVMQEAAKGTRCGIRLQSLSLVRQVPSECNFDQPGRCSKGASEAAGPPGPAGVSFLGERRGLCVSVVTLGERRGVVCECGHLG